MTRAYTDRAAALAAPTEQQARIKRENAKDKHTPGPWELEEWNSDYGATGDFSIYQSMQKGCRMPIASVQQPFNGKRTKANARLIAAAPDLLEAAKLVLAWYESEDDHSKADFYERMEMCRASEMAIRAAIAKATGETA